MPRFHPFFSAASALPAISVLLAITPVTLATAPSYYHRIMPSHPSNGEGTILTDINNQGLVVGRSGWEGLTERRESPFIAQWNGDLQNLDTLGFDLHAAVLVNDAGETAGVGSWWTSTNGNTTCGASTLWRRPTSGDMTRPGPIFRAPRLVALNDRGDLIIESNPAVPHDLSAPTLNRHAYFIDSLGRALELDSLGGFETLAADMNSLGQVVGESDTGEVDRGSRAVSHAFLWDAGAMLDLGTLGGQNSAAQRINDTGLIVGRSEATDGRMTLFTWTSAAGMQPLALPFQVDFLEVTALSETGWIVGEFGGATPDGRSAAFAFSPDCTFHEIAPFGPTDVLQPAAVNARGEVVGTSFDSLTFQARAWVWTAADGLTDLNLALVEGPIDFALQVAVDINDCSQIIVQGGQFAAPSSAVLWPKRPADLNCDGRIDFFDVDGFLLALFDRDAYAAQFPACEIRNADVNESGTVEFSDIDEFVALLFGA